MGGEGGASAGPSRAGSVGPDGGAGYEVEGQAPKGVFDFEWRGEAPCCVEVSEEATEEMGLSRCPGKSKVDEGEIPGLTCCLVVLGEEGGKGTDRLRGKGGNVGRLA